MTTDNILFYNPPLRHVFVYGTLQSGEHNNHLLNQEKFVSKATTEGTFILRDAGFPYAHPSDGREAFPVCGEVFTCSPESLANLDILEGYEEGREYNHYERVAIMAKLDDGATIPCYMYIVEEDPSSYPLCDMIGDIYVW